MSFLAPLALCFSVFLLFFVIFLFAVPGMKLHLELWASLLGLCAVLPIAFIEFFLSGFSIFKITGFFSAFFTAFILNGLIEEIFKTLFMNLIPAKNQKLSVFFSLSILFALALSGFESVIYLLTFLQKNIPESVGSIYKLVILRLCTSVPIHVFCSGLAGLTLWTFRTKKTNVIPLMLSVGLHGLYDFFARYPKPLYYFIIAVILYVAINCRIYYVEISGEKQKKLKDFEVSETDKKIDETLFTENSENETKEENPKNDIKSDNSEKSEENLDKLESDKK